MAQLLFRARRANSAPGARGRGLAAERRVVGQFEVVEMGCRSGLGGRRHGGSWLHRGEPEGPRRQNTPGGPTLGTITPCGNVTITACGSGGDTVPGCRPVRTKAPTARSPTNVVSASRLTIPATQTLPRSRGFKLTHYRAACYHVATNPSATRPTHGTLPSVGLRGIARRWVVLDRLRLWVLRRSTSGILPRQPLDFLGLPI